MRLSRFFLWAFVVGLVLFVVSIPLAYFLMPAGGMFFGPLELVVSLGVLILCWLLTCFICASVHDRGVAPHLMRSGIVMASIGTFGWIAWFAVQMFGMMMLSFEGRLLEWAMVLVWPTVWGGWCALIGILLLIRPRAPWWARLRAVTIILLTLLALWIGLSVLLERDYYTGENFATVWFAGHLGLVAMNVFMSYQFAALLGLVAVAGFLLPLPRGERAARIARFGLVLISALAVLTLVITLMIPQVASSTQLREMLAGYSRYEWYGAYAATPTMFEMIMYPLGAMLGLLTGILFLASIGSAVLLKLSGRAILDQERLTYDLTCPRCATEERALTGEHLCSSCGLRIRLDLT